MILELIRHVSALETGLGEEIRELRGLVRPRFWMFDTFGAIEKKYQTRDEVPRPQERG